MQPLRSVGRSNFDKGRHNLTTLIKKSTYINESCYIIYIYIYIYLFFHADRTLTLVEARSIASVINLVDWFFLAGRASTLAAARSSGSVWHVLCTTMPISISWTTRLAPSILMSASTYSVRFSVQTVSCVTRYSLLVSSTCCPSIPHRLSWYCLQMFCSLRNISFLVSFEISADVGLVAIGLLKEYCCQCFIAQRHRLYPMLVLFVIP